jgi:hypothetical protein
MSKTYLQFLFLLFCLLPAAVAPAQTTQATITGIITDESRSPLPGATVMVRNESTGFTAGTATNAKGEFIFNQLPLGNPYSVTVSSIGFGTEKRTGYALNQGDVLRVDVPLKVSEQTLDAVVVNASALQNQVNNFGAATSVTARDIAKLPVNGRNFTSLIDLSPLSRGGNLAGQLASSTNFTIDGMTAKNPTSGGPTNRNGGPYAISMEAVREFNVVTNQYDVTFGRSGGGTISTVTKSGTNTLSGSAFTFARADWLSSRYDIRGNRRNVDFSTYQYGFSLGGPIVKDKAHFFVVWDHQADARPLQDRPDRRAGRRTAPQRDAGLAGPLPGNCPGQVRRVRRAAVRVVRQTARHRRPVWPHRLAVGQKQPAHRPQQLRVRPQPVGQRRQHGHQPVRGVRPHQVP